MDLAFRSSGDLIADRRASYAQMLAQAGAFSQAAEVMVQALEAAPNWAAGWMLLADFQQAAAHPAAAIAAWQQAAALDPTGALGAQMQLAAHGVGAVAQPQRAAYVAALFDHYAGEFETALVERLDYVVPDLLFGMISDVMAENGMSQFARMLDLGCGTGLMGDRMRKLVSHLSGIDLSGAMVTEAQRKGTYDAVIQAELGDYLGGVGPGSQEVITAADVFMYCAALEPIFSDVLSALAPGGLFAFSVESWNGAEAQMLQSSLRYAHRPDHVIEALRTTGFEVVADKRDTIRLDRAMPVAGLMVVARKARASEIGTMGLSDAVDIDTASDAVLLN